MGSAAEQGSIWGARARDWAEANEPAWGGVFTMVLDAAGVREGSDYLDIGCGSGGALLEAERRGARVAGLDAAEALVAIARERLPDAEILSGEMEALPFGDGRFDAVTAINSIQFSEKPAKAMTESARVTRPGGRIAVLVWGPRERCELIRDVASKVFALNPPGQPGRSKPIPWHEAGIIEDLMIGAGVAPEAAKDIEVDLRFPDADTAVRAIASPAERAVAHAGERAVLAVAAEAIRPFTTPDGRVILKNSFRIVTGRKPDR